MRGAHSEILFLICLIEVDSYIFHLLVVMSSDKYGQL